MKKVIISAIAIILLVFTAGLVSCVKRPPQNGNQNTEPPVLENVSIKRKSSSYVDNENTLCLKLNGSVCEDVTVTLEFTNNSNFNIYSVNIDSVDYDKSRFKSGYSPQKVVIDVSPLFKSAGNYSIVVKEIHYSTDTAIKPLENFSPVSIPVRVAPKFEVTVDMTATQYTTDNNIEELGDIGFMDDMSFLRSATMMNSPSAAPAGYGFVGWYSTPNPDIAKDKAYKQGDAYEFYADMTFYAVYECMFTYFANETTGTTTITGLTNTGRKQYTIEIPDTLGGYPIKYIGERAFEDASITNITCNPSLMTIEARAFQNSSLQGISFNEGLKEIEMYAFSGCTKIASMNMFPSSLTTIGAKAFEYCGWDTYIGAFKIDNTLIVPNTVINIGDGGFQYSTFKKVYFEDYGDLPQAETNFGKELFLSSSTLESVKTAAKHVSANNFTNGTNGLKKLPNQAFKYCSKLSSVELSEGLTEVGTEAFMCVSGTMANFDSITLPDSLETIYSYAFANVPLTALNFKNETTSKLTKIGDYAFQVSKLSGKLNLYAPMLADYGASPFWGSLDITSIFIYSDNTPEFDTYNKNTVQSLNPRIKYYVPQANLSQYRTEWKVRFEAGYGGFSLSTPYEPLIYAMEDITADGKYSYILKNDGGDIYAVLTNIFDIAGTTITIADTVTVGTTYYYVKEIGSYVASADITEVKFVRPDFLLRIGNNAFNGSSALASFCPSATSGSKFELFENLVYIGEYAFSGTAISRFVAPASLREIDYGAFYNADNLNFVMISGAYSGTNSLLIDVNAFEYCEDLDNVVLGSRVKTIGSQAFAYCPSLGTFVMEHTEFPLFTSGLDGGIVGILGDNNLVTTIYATAQLITLRNSPTSSLNWYSYKQYTYVEGEWDYDNNRVRTL